MKQHSTPMNTDDTSTAAAQARQAYTLYAASGHVYASNAKQKLIDLGTLTQEPDGFSYQLDGNGQSGSGFPDAEAALRDLGRDLQFLFLDGQFTALVDVRGGQGIDLAGVPQMALELDELAPGQPMQDARS